MEAATGGAEALVVDPVVPNVPCIDSCATIRAFHKVTLEGEDEATRAADVKLDDTRAGTILLLTANVSGVHLRAGATSVQRGRRRRRASRVKLPPNSRAPTRQMQRLLRRHDASALNHSLEAGSESQSSSIIAGISQQLAD